MVTSYCTSLWSLFLDVTHVIVGDVSFHLRLPHGEFEECSFFYAGVSLSQRGAATPVQPLKHTQTLKSKNKTPEVPPQSEY